MFRMTHTCISVMDLDRSLAFYEKALGLREVRRKEAADGSYTLVFLGDGASSYQLELTWQRDWEKDHYDLGDNESHIGFVTEHFDEAHRLHEQMGVICFENKTLGIYFIEDPDGYWLEVVPKR